MIPFDFQPAKPSFHKGSVAPLLSAVCELVVVPALPLSGVGSAAGEKKG